MCRCKCPLALRRHFHLKRVFHPGAARPSALTSDRAARFIFAPIQIDLQRMPAPTGVANEPFFAASFLVDRLRFDPQPGMLTQKLVTRRNRAGAAGHQHFAATSDRRISECVSVIAHPADIVSAVNCFVDSTEAFFLYGQKKIARVLSGMQARRSDRCRVESALGGEAGFLWSVINGTEENAWINRAVRHLFGANLVRAMF